MQRVYEMSKTEYTLKPEDKELWQRYIKHFLSKKEPITPKYTYNDIDSRKLDLHGFTANSAWIRFKEFVEYHYANGAKSVVIITGRSGLIVKEFQEWCILIPIIRDCEPLGNSSKPAGSYRVNFKSAKNSTS
jgi:hypothetical protein